jgi:hypothetical protein
MAFEPYSAVTACAYWPPPITDTRYSAAAHCSTSNPRAFDLRDDGAVPTACRVLRENSNERAVRCVERNGFVAG